MAFGGLGGVVSGGISLGTAVANIVVNAAQLLQLPTVVRNVSRQVSQSFGGMGAGLVSFGQSVKKIQTDLLALGAATGILTKIGLGAAGSVQEAHIQFEGLLGSVQRANKLMDDLRKKAASAGLPFTGMLDAAKQMLPTLRGNTKELDKYIDLARRVATRNSQQGISGAAFSINEALVSQGADFVSLGERFNISKRALQQEMVKNGGDLAKALDIVLNKMGITEETADRMGKTFNASLTVAKDAAVQLLAQGFTPLLNVLGPILQGTASLLSDISQNHPVFAQMASGILAAVTAGVSLVLVIGNITNAITRMNKAQMFGGMAGKIGAGVGIVGTAAAIGFGAGNFANSMAGNKTVSPEQVTQYVIHLFMTMSAGLQSFANWLNEGFARGIDGATQAIGRFITAMGQAIVSLGKIVPGSVGQNLQAAGQPLIGQGLSMQTSTAATDKARAREARGIQNYDALGESLGVWTTQVQTAAQTAAQTEAEENIKRTQSIVQWAHDVDRIENDAHQARIDALEAFERQQAETIANYSLQRSRQAEDDAIADRQAQQAFEDQKANIRSDEADQEVQWREELDKSIADKRRQSADKLLELEKDYNKQRERDAEDHHDKLMDAAANLDASGVAEEQRRFARDQQRAEEDYAEKVQKEQKNVDEDVRREEDANDKRVERARHAEERRLSELDVQFQKQRELELADRTLRDSRAAEDRDRTLASQQAAYELQQAQINRQEQESLTAANQANMDRLSDMGQALESQRIMEQRYQEEALKRWGLFYGELDKLNKSLLDARPPTKEQAEANKPSLLNPYADVVDNYNQNKSGAVPGLYPGSQNFNPNDPSTFPSLVNPWLHDQQTGPTSMTPTPASGATSAAISMLNTPRNVSIDIAERAIVVEEAHSPEATGQAVYAAVAQILQTVAG